MSVREGGDGDEDQTQFDHLLVLCPDLSASADAEALSDVVDLLTGAARLLPSAASARNRAPSFSFVCLRSSDASGQGHYDWSPDAFAAAVHLERRQLRVRSLEFLGAEGQPARVAEALVAELPMSGALHRLATTRRVDASSANRGFKIVQPIHHAQTRSGRTMSCWSPAEPKGSRRAAPWPWPARPARPWSWSGARRCRMLQK